MRFIDEARIRVTAGNGGRGCTSFRREKFVPRGGPDGGDGGKGGDVIFVADERLESLIDFRYVRAYKAQSGAHGKGKRQHGKAGKDRIIPVPVGTLVKNETTGELLRDLSSPGEQLVVARGGLGGKGNAHFVSATHQTPRYSQNGQEGEEQQLQLELKLLADVGVIGLPNSGKSTFVACVSAAKPRIADYPFTTLNPCLGVVRYHEEQTFIVADIPGLIEGAHLGSGLGTTFLRHIERTRVLIHLIDSSQVRPHDPLRDFSVVNDELTFHNPDLLERPQVVAMNKMDLPQSQANYRLCKEHFTKLRIKSFPISAATGKGVKPLIAHVSMLLTRLDSTKRH
jgi:GTP-binding protein